MSQIFDALQQSHAQHYGIDLSVLPDATELMATVDEDVALELGTAEHSCHSDVMESVTNATEVNISAVPGKQAADIRVNAFNKVQQDIFARMETVQISSPVNPRLASLTDRTSLGAEAFRMLKVKLQKIRKARLIKTLLITSTIPQEGKSTVAANLACAIGLKSEQKVLLLEGDLRCPTLSQIFGIEKRSGIREHLQDGYSLSKCICYLEGAGIWLLPAGSTDNNSLELLQSGRETEMMSQLASWFDWIIVDSPPLLPLADTSVWMQLADATLLVLRIGATKKSQLERALELLEPKKVIGALLNGSKNPVYGDYYQYYSPDTSLKSHSKAAK